MLSAPRAVTPVRKFCESLLVRIGVATCVQEVPSQCADTVSVAVSPTTHTSSGAIAVTASANWMPPSAGGVVNDQVVPFQCSSNMAMNCSVVSSNQPTAHRSLGPRSEEHTSELQSQSNLVCRLLLE